MNHKDSISPATSKNGIQGFFSKLASLLGFGYDDEEAPNRSSLEEALRDYLQDEHLPAKEKHMLINMIRFGEMTVEDIMVRRPDIIALEVASTLEEVLDTFQKYPFARLPIYKDTLDNPLGILHVKDLLATMSQKYHGKDEVFSLSQLQRNILFVPPSMLALELLIRMQISHIHMALVIDEYGGTDGLVTLVDLIEEIVGDMSDTGDANMLTYHGDGTIEVNAKIFLESLEEELGIKLLDPNDEKNEEIDTLGGLIVSHLGRVPTRGEKIRHPFAPISFEILDADPRRVKRVLIHSSVEMATVHD